MIREARLRGGGADPDASSRSGASGAGWHTCDEGAAGSDGGEEGEPAAPAPGSASDGSAGVDASDTSAGEERGVDASGSSAGKSAPWKKAEERNLEKSRKLMEEPGGFAFDNERIRGELAKNATNPPHLIDKRCVFLFNIGDWALWHARYASYIKVLLHTFQDHFPETVLRVYVGDSSVTKQ